MSPAALAMLAAAGLAAVPAAGDLLSVRFACAGGTGLPVVFVNPEGGPSYAVVELDGRLIGMRQVVSGSGARYRSAANADLPVEYQLWIKGDRATLSAGPDGQDRIVFSDCPQEP